MRINFEVNMGTTRVQGLGPKLKPTTRSCHHDRVTHVRVPWAKTTCPSKGYRTVALFATRYIYSA